jgi:L-amino acid N-acyltransferase YncA
MALLIREARLDDAEAVVGILNPIIESGMYSALDTPLTVEAERDFIRNFPRRGLFHISENSQDEGVVGLQTLEPYATYTHAFDHVAVIATYVKLGFRRRGVGTRLSEATFERARDKRYEKVFTFVRVDNREALEFYLKLGFHVVGTAQRQARIGDNYIDEVIIEKFL